MPSENRSKKRKQKRRRSPPLRVECGGLRAVSRNARFLLRKAFARLTKKNLYTPALPAQCGGLSSHTRRPPHSTKLLALIFVKRLIRILAVSARILTDSFRFLPESCLSKYELVRKQQCQEHIKTQTIAPKSPKSIKNMKNGPRAEKVAPRIGKGAKKGQGGTRFGPLQGT